MEDETVTPTVSVGPVGEVDREVDLDDIWTYYFHDPADTRDWSNESYRVLGSVSDIATFWRVQISLRPFLQAGMFFLFRDPVFPKWDHAMNIDGGCVSFKVVRTDIIPFLEGILIDVLRGDGLSPSDSDGDTINGVSISPKNGFVVVKIWMRDESCKTRRLRLPVGYKGEVLWRSNRESLHVDSTARVVRPPQNSRR